LNPEPLGFSLNRQNGIFRANLRTDGAAGAEICINLDPVIPDVKCRACQRINAGSVILAFAADVEWFAPGQFQCVGIQGTYFFGYYDRTPFSLDDKKILAIFDY